MCESGGGTHWARCRALHSHTCDAARGGQTRPRRRIRGESLNARSGRAATRCICECDAARGGDTRLLWPTQDKGIKRAAAVRGCHGRHR
jgi:hypothetical protein